MISIGTKVVVKKTGERGVIEAGFLSDLTGATELLIETEAHKFRTIKIPAKADWSRYLEAAN